VIVIFVFTITSARKDAAMALTARERKRRQVEREQIARKLRDDVALAYVKKPFFEVIAGHHNELLITMSLDAAGFAMPGWTDDSGPKSASGQIENYDAFEGHQGSIGRAEVMIEGLLDAASELAEIVNEYKREALAQRLDELASNPSADDETRRVEFQEAIKVSKALEHLQRRVRRDIAQWSAKL
jgi:hypothetical protein